MITHQFDITNIVQQWESCGQLWLEMTKTQSLSAASFRSTASKLLIFLAWVFSVVEIRGQTLKAEPSTFFPLTVQQILQPSKYLLILQLIDSQNAELCWLVEKWYIKIVGWYNGRKLNGLDFSVLVVILLLKKSADCKKIAFFNQLLGT